MDELEDGSVVARPDEPSAGRRRRHAAAERLRLDLSKVGAEDGGELFERDRSGVGGRTEAMRSWVILASRRRSS
jgi:hypothetical protein